jgi:hypothetical protein
LQPHFECTRANKSLRNLSNKIFYLIAAVIMLALWAGGGDRQTGHQASVAQASARS